MPDRSRAPNALTIMMTDVVGSTALRRTRGDRDADDMLGAQATIVREQVTTFGGRVRKSLGDGFLISFPSIVSAVRAAVGLAKPRIRDLDPETKTPPRDKPRRRRFQQCEWVFCLTLAAKPGDDLLFRSLS